MLVISPYFDISSDGRVAQVAGARSVGPFVLVGIVLWMLWATSAGAGTIRHDRDDSLYTSLAALPQYDCAGMVQLGSSVGSGTLIASEWVLTAGHLTGNDTTFTVDGTTYEAIAGSYQKHPTEDIGVFRLSMPVAGVTPAMLYDPLFGSEIGLDGTMVGFGNTGNGLTGEMLWTTGTKRAGQNTIDARGTFWNWSSNLLLVDFDSPNGLSSTLGSNLPLDLEIGPAHGDSGCGLFVEHNGQTYLAGVQSEMWYSDGTDNADYGDGGIFISVGRTLNWIDGIVPRNLAPVALNDSYQVGEDQWLNVVPYGNPPVVLANDYDPNGDAIDAVINEGPLHGSLYFSGNGSFEYLADENYFGTDSFSYRAYDGQQYSDPATVSLDITPINDAPLALDDAYEIEYGDEFTAVQGVLENDSDIEDDELRAILQSYPDHGTVELNADGTFVFRADPFYSGEDSFTYMAFDEQMLSQLSTVSILVKPSPTPGDANRDGIVDDADAALLVLNWQSTDAQWSDGDFNADGKVDDIDATILATNWQNGSMQAVNIPEPHNLTILIGLFVGGLFSGRRGARRNPLPRLFV